MQIKKPVNGSQEPQAGPSTGDITQEEQSEEAAVPEDIYTYYDKMDKEEEEGEDLKTVSFEVKQDNIEVIQKR